MSEQQIFDDIMNNFNSDEEGEIEEREYIKNNNKNIKHKVTSSLAEKNYRIKEKLSNTQDENNIIKPQKQSRRDQFGYIINYDENEESEEIEESNQNNEEKQKNEENECEQDIIDENEYSYKEKEKEDLNNSNQEENNNYEIQSNKNSIVEDSQNKKDENKKEENHDNNEYIENNNNDNNKNENTVYEHLYNDRKNDLFNELYQSKHENLDSVEWGGFRMDSFRPNPIPGSPKFTKRISIDNNQSSEIKNNNINNNNVSNNFTETIETKIEGDLNNSIKGNPLNNNSIYTHNNVIISLGKMPNKDNITTFESFQKKSIKNKKDVNQNKNSEDEEKEEEAFLKREELKRQKYKEDKVVNNNITEEKEDEGKENVTEDEEENQTGILNKFKVQTNIENEKVKYNLNNKKEKLKEEVTEDEDEEENNKKINSINTNNSIKKEPNIKINDIKVRDISIKLLEQYKKAGDSINSSIIQSEKNSIYNNTDSNMELSSLINKKNNIKNNGYSKNKNSKKKNIVIPNSRNSKYNSPYNKNNNNNNNTYRSSENKSQVISTINKNTSFKLNSNFNSNYNSNFSKKMNVKNNPDLQSIKKNLYNPKNEIKSKLFEPKATKKIIYNSEKYSFLPKIDRNSRKICDKNNNKNKRSNTPIGVLLYKEANIKKEKLNQICLTENNNIKSKANIKKINSNSYSLAIERINKKIDNVIKKYSINGKLSIVSVTQCLYDLNIITELIKAKDNTEVINEDLDFVELQSLIESINQKDNKKLEETEFLEQLWFIINPSLNQYINSQILSELLKILFSSNNNFKDVEKLFDKYNINKNNDNKDDKLYPSPLRDKKYNKNELWPLNKFIKIFLNLKQNLKAYKKNDYQKGDIYNNIIKERDKDLTFQPDVSSNSFFYKHSKYNYNKDNSITDSPNSSFVTNNSKKQKHDFDKIYERFMAEKMLQEKTLERIRKIKQEKELKMCTKIPKINKYVPKSSDRTVKKKTRMVEPESKILRKNNSTIDIKLPRFLKLYKMKKKDYAENKKLEDNCTFKPNIMSNNEILNRTFSNMSKIKPKGFDNYVERNRSLLKKKEYQKKLEEDKKYGKNYEKIQKKKIKPFNITDLNGTGRKKKKIIMSNSSRNNESNNNNSESVSNYEKDKMKNIIDDVYITIDIKIPNGLSKPLKIYNKNYNDTVDFVNNFCKIYSINDENKKIILKKVIQYKNTFFGRNLIEENNRDGIVMNEDLDTITNTYSNNSNH